MKPEQVTAWALNELSAEDRAHVEAAIAASPEVRTQAEHVQEFCGLLASELTDEEAALGDERREALLARVSGKVVSFDATTDAEPVRRKSRRMDHMRGLQARDGWKAGWMVRVAAIAACAVLVGVMVFEVKQPRMEQTVVAVPVNSERVKVTAVEPAKTGTVSKSLEPVVVVAPSPVIAPKPVLSPPKPVESSMNKPMAALVTQVPKPDTVKTTVERWSIGSNAFIETAKTAALIVDLNVQRDGMAMLKRSLDAGKLPGADFRVADLVNSFAYSDPAPALNETLNVTASVVEVPWAPTHRLVRVAIRARDGSDEVVARSVKLELAFNPAVVQSHRLLGFDSAKQGGTVKAAELRAGQTVVVLVEIVPIKTQAINELLADASRYPDKSAKSLPSLTGVPRLKPLSGGNDELLTVSVPYQAEGSELVKCTELPVRDAHGSIASADEDTRFTVAVTAFGMMLRGESDGLSWEVVRRLAEHGVVNDPRGERKAWSQFIDRAAKLKP